MPQVKLTGEVLSVAEIVVAPWLCVDFKLKGDVYFLQVDSEEPVFEAVLNWVKHNRKERESNLPDMLEFVRMPLLTPRYITDVIDAEVSQASPRRSPVIFGGVYSVIYGHKRPFWHVSAPHPVQPAVPGPRGRSQEISFETGAEERDAGSTNASQTR